MLILAFNGLTWSDLGGQKAGERRVESGAQNWLMRDGACRRRPEATGRMQAPGRDSARTARRPGAQRVEGQAMRGELLDCGSNEGFGGAFGHAERCDRGTGRSRKPANRAPRCEISRRGLRQWPQAGLGTARPHASGLRHLTSVTHRPRPGACIRPVFLFRLGKRIVGGPGTCFIGRDREGKTVANDAFALSGGWTCKCGACVSEVLGKIGIMAWALI